MCHDMNLFFMVNLEILGESWDFGVNHLIAHLPEDVGRSVQHHVDETAGRAPPTYAMLKELILEAWDMPLSQRLSALLDLRSLGDLRPSQMATHIPVSYTHLRAHET